MRAKEYLAIVRVRDDVRGLTLKTMLFADEVRPTKGIAAPARSHTSPRQQLDAAVAVIEELSCEWDPAKYKDRYRSRLRTLVERKRKEKNADESARAS